MRKRDGEMRMREWEEREGDKGGKGGKGGEWVRGEK